MRSIARNILPALLMVLLSVAAFAQAKPQPRNLVVNGQNGKADVIDLSGRSFIDVSALASIGQGSVSFSGPGIVLTIPAAAGGAATAASAAPAAPPAQPLNSSALSQGFMKAGIEEIASLREWATTLGSAIRGGYGVTDEWVNGYRDQASQNLQLADASTTTDGDRNAAQVLHRAFTLVQQWSDKLVAEKKSMDTAKYATSPGALREDPLSQKLIACGHFVAQMLGSGTYQDDASCH